MVPSGFKQFNMVSGGSMFHVQLYHNRPERELTKNNNLHEIVTLNHQHHTYKTSPNF